MKITTFTPNPAIDCFGKADKIEIGEISRISIQSKYPGGKGVNVSRVLLALGVRTTALTPIGGYTGQSFIKLMQEFKIPFSAFKIAAETRINYIFENSNGQRIKFNIDGGELHKEEQTGLSAWIIPHCGNGDILYIGGSPLKGMDEGFYLETADTAAQNGVHLALDISGKTIFNLSDVKYKYFKANLEESCSIFSRRPHSLEECYDFSCELDPDKEIIISDKENGAALFTKGKIYRNFMRKTKETLCSGCGDALFAAYLARRTQGDDPKVSFNYAGAAGLSCAFSGVYELCDKKSIRENLNFIDTERIK